MATQKRNYPSILWNCACGKDSCPFNNWDSSKSKKPLLSDSSHCCVNRDVDKVKCKSRFWGPCCEKTDGGPMLCDECSPDIDDDAKNNNTNNN